MTDKIKGTLKKFNGNNIVWIIFLTVLFALYASAAAGVLLCWLLDKTEWPPGVRFINELYTYSFGAIIIINAVCLIVKKNRFILRSFLPAGMGRDHEVLVEEDTYEPTQNNTLRNLLLGLLLGFVTNFMCIACALVHGDIKLYFDFSAAQIPVLIYGFLMVLVQSGSEEMWLRGYMYERLNIHYPLWVAIAANGSLFGLLHCFNEGASVFSVTVLIVFGIEFSMIRWYSESIWFAAGAHTMWNFTQNLLFGLPNSGFVSEFSVLHLDAANGVTNLIYDYEFGVEGAVPSLLSDVIIIAVIILLAKKTGRLGELRMSYEKAKAIKAAEKV